VAAGDAGRAAVPLDVTISDIDIDTAILALPENHRAVFVLHDIEGRTHAEIAEVLGIAAGSSKAYLHHARQRMRALLRGEDMEGST
jgi:RNA polymerase sigma-70 factor (ECF subfamily)